MHRIDGDGHTVDYKFTEGNPGTGTPPTRITDDWLNDVQENIAAFIEAMSIVLSKGDSTQLKSAVDKMVRRSDTIVVASTTSKATSQLNADTVISTSADAGAAINTLISSLSATGGGTIRVLEGTYNIATTINVNVANVQIIGAGNTTVFNRAGEISSILEITATNCHVTRIYFDGKKATYTTASYDGIKLSSTYGVVDCCYVTGNKRHGVFIVSVNYNKITGNTIAGNDSAGIITSGGYNVIQNNHSVSNGEQQIYASGAENVISGNYCEGGTLGIYVTANANIISNNMIRNVATGYGIQVNSQSCTISGNACRSNSVGIVLYGAKFATVVGNVCNANGTFGISLSTSSISNNVVGNTCLANTSTGITIDAGSNNNVIQNNRTVDGSGASAITNNGTGNSVQTNY